MASTHPSSSSNWEPPLPEDLQRMLPQYEITGILGRGGMGAVYRGRQTKLDRDVAIKLLCRNRAERDSLPPGSPAGVSDGAAGAKQTFTKGDDELNFAKRFEQEAKAMAKLDHPAILSVHDFGETSEGQLYFVMEFIDGMDIHQYLREHGGKLPQEHALSIAAHVLDALDYAHSHGIVHRDIKPANVLLNREGRVKIADFGLAKKLSEAGGDSVPALTMSNVAVGTPDFVAPEALDPDQTPDQRADLYAVGVMLYQMLTGKLPRGNFRWPSEIDSEIDPRLDDIVSKAMESDPAYRYQSAAAVRADLDVIFSQPMPKVEAGEISGKVAAAVPVTTSVKGKKGKKGTKETSKLPVYVGIGAAGVAVVSIVVFATMVDSVEDGAPEPVAAAVEEKVASASPPVSSVEKPVDAEQQTIAGTPKETPAENTTEGGPGWMPVPNQAGPAAADALPAADSSPLALAPPTAVSSPPSETPLAETPLAETAPSESPPTAKTGEPLLLAAVPGLQSRLDGYFSARNAQVGDLAGKYRRGLDARLNQAADAGNLSLAKAFRDEIARVEDLQAGLAVAPDDRSAAAGEFSDLPELPEESPESLASLRSAWGTERAKIRDDLDGKLRHSLQALKVELTQAREFEQAEAVQAFRESLGTDKVEVATAEKAEPEADSRIPATALPELASATKEAPFENSLGMKFVPVPGTEALFCIDETRRKDYAVYAEENPGIDAGWTSVDSNGFSISERVEDHPVWRVSWDDAQGFAHWLSLKESRTYRLPTDEEWSVAVGLGRKERRSRSDTPESLRGKVEGEYPWGTAWPPPVGAGNYGDESYKENIPSEGAVHLEDHDDGFPTTAPVMSFSPNQWGLYDMGGNVQEWVEDWFNAARDHRVMRGSAWTRGGENALRSSNRDFISPATRNGTIGFRVVLELAPPTVSSEPAPAEVTHQNPFGWKPLPENPFPLPRPTRPTTPCRVVAWRLDGEPVNAEDFRKLFGGLPDDLGEVVDLAARNFDVTRFVYPLALSASGKVLTLHQSLQSPIPEDLKAAVMVSGGRDIAAALHTDGTVTPLYLSPSALQRSEMFSGVTSWKEIVQMSTSDGSIFGVNTKGELFAAGTNERGETNIPAQLRIDIVSLHIHGPTGRVLQNRAKDYHIAYVGMGSGTFSHATPKNSRVLLSSNVYVADERGVIRYCNVGRTYPASTENLRGSTRNVRDISVSQVSQTNENGIAALREGEDQWRFWGDRKELGGFDPKYCEEKAAGCWKLFFMGDYVLALKPVANLKPDDWTGASP